jgi:uncharacterized membrane protein YfcA
MPAIDILILLGTGVGVGLAQGILGVGGGFIMVPVLVALFQRQGFPIDIAIPLAFGSSLLVIFITAVSSSRAHHREGNVWWKAAAVMGVAGAAGAGVGSTLTSQVISGEAMKSVFGVVVILAGVRMLLWTGPKSEGELQENPAIWFVWGFPTGVIVGLIGTGGGILAVPIMATIFKFKMHRAVGTSNGMMLFTASAGALGYLLNGLEVSGLPQYSVGYVSLLAWICLAPTSVTAAQIGTKLGHRLTEQVVRVLFVLLMLYIGLNMLGMFECI